MWKWKLDGGIFDLQKNWVHVWHCLAVSASFWPILGAFGLALQNVGLMLGCGCHHGVLMVSPSCRLGSVSGFVVLWVVGVLCLGSAGRIGGMSVVIWWRLGGVSVMSWCNPAVYPFLLRRCVLVALGRACMCVMLRLRVILLVLRWHLSRTFGIFWWCMRGLLLVGVLLVLACHFLVVSQRYVSAHMGGH